MSEHTTFYPAFVPCIEWCVEPNAPMWVVPYSRLEWYDNGIAYFSLYYPVTPPMTDPEQGTTYA